MPYFPARLDFPSPPLSAPGSPRMGIRLLTTSARLYFRLYLGPPQEEKERGLTHRTAASNRAEICFCMYSTAFASISSTALETEALSFAVNRFRKKTKEHSEPK